MDQQGLLKCTNKNLQVSAPISIRNCRNFAGIGVSSRCKQKFTSAHACKLLAQSGVCALQKSSFGKFGLCKKAPLVYLGSAKEPHDLNTSCSHGLFGHVPRQGDTWSPSPETVSALMAFQSAHSTSRCPRTWFYNSYLECQTWSCDGWVWAARLDGTSAMWGPTCYRCGKAWRDSFLSKGFSLWDPPSQRADWNHGRGAESA